MDFEVCRRIRENTDWAGGSHHFPLVGGRQGPNRSGRWKSGGVDYITKPFNHAELVTRVRKPTWRSNGLRDEFEATRGRPG